MRPTVNPRHHVPALAALLLAATGACTGGGREAHGASPAAALALVDSLVIIETPEAYVARPTHLSVSERHGLFITDAFARNVIHVRVNGEVVGGIGRRGRGPGEFEAPSTVLVAHDSLLYVADQMRGGVVVRSLVTGQERGVVRMEGNRPTMTIIGDTVYAGTVNATRGTSLARWTTGGDSVRYFGALPESFTRSPFSRFIFNVSLAAWRDTLAYMVGLSEVVYIATSDGTLRDSLVVPRAHRRGVPSVARQATLRDPSAVAAASSIPWALGALSDGRLVAVFADGEVRANTLGGKVYVSVLSRGGGASCPDVPLPSDGHELPRIAFDGDQMLVLEQRVVGGKALNVVRRYSFPAPCVVVSS
jgi:hypothetical protein